MAGDWIQIRHDLLDDYAVLRLIQLLDIDPDLLTGKLVRFWLWIDRQTGNGRLNGIAADWIDAWIDQPGFAAAMVKVGWLQFDNSDMVIPGWDEFFSDSAKARAKGLRRVQKHRMKRSCNATALQGDAPGVTRVEKSREEKSRDTDIPIASKSNSQREVARAVFEQHPNPVGFDKCADTVMLAVDEIGVDELRARVIAYGRSVAGRDEQYIKLACNWFDEGFWKTKPRKAKMLTKVDP